MSCQNCYNHNNTETVTLNCQHTFHVRCILDHIYNNDTRCPICKNKIEDIRILVATAFERGSVNELISYLQ